MPTFQSSTHPTTTLPGTWTSHAGRCFGGEAGLHSAGGGVEMGGWVLGTGSATSGFFVGDPDSVLSPAVAALAKALSMNGAGSPKLIPWAQRGSAGFDISFSGGEWRAYFATYED